MQTWLVIPALNEERSIGRVLDAVPRCVDGVVVVDNGSTDRTAEIASKSGAHVVREPRRGYGSACLAGIAALPDETAIVAFVDADFSDHPENLERVLEPVEKKVADLVIGSRVLGQREPGALLPQQRVGNWLASRLMRWLFRQRCTDLGPMRAIERSALDRLDMRDRTFGWTVEMQAKAAIGGLRVQEVPVDYRRRIGKSKITGTLTGSVRAGAKILWTIFKLRLQGKAALSVPRARSSAGSSAGGT